jgi:hypothetical protein
MAGSPVIDRMAAHKLLSSRPDEFISTGSTAERERERTDEGAKTLPPFSKFE